MKTYRRAQEAVSQIIEAFKEGTIPEAMSQQFINWNADIPCRKWSPCNQLLVALAGFRDARGYRQWQEAGRQVLKGQKGVPILIPLHYKVEDEEREDGEPEYRLSGFSSAIVFGKKQTEGDPVPGDEENEEFIRNLPLIEVAEAWGVTVETYNGKGARAEGKHRSGHIALGVKNLSTWAHEMVHEAEDQILGGLKGGQDPKQEIVAELGGATLLELIGHETASDRGGAYEYVKRYAKGDPSAECLNLVNRISSAVSRILNEAERIQHSQLVAQ